jgi:hypothetical protein
MSKNYGYEPADAEMIEIDPSTPNSRAFKNDFKRKFGVNWEHAGKVEKEKFVVDRVLALWTKWKNYRAQGRKNSHPFVAEDFNLTEEEFNLLPHKWFKGVYITLKISVGQSLNVALTPFERELDLGPESEITRATQRKNPPQRSLLGWLGGSTRKSKRRNKRTYKNRR